MAGKVVTPVFHSSIIPVSLFKPGSNESTASEKDNLDGYARQIAG